jgi:hypothetical protein
MTSGGLARRAGSWVVLGALLAAPLAPLAGAAGAATPSGAGTAAAAKPAPPVPARPRRDDTGAARLPAGHPLPDSVLAVVDGARTITADAFRRGWAQLTPPARPEFLTPESARQFLDLLVDKELLAARAGGETWEWTAVESAQVANLRDRTLMRVALDSTMGVVARARAARGDSALSAEALGVAARESTVARLDVSYDEVLLARLARAWGALPRPSADSTIWVRLRTLGQMPVIEPSDSGRVVAWSAAGTLRAADLLDAWKKLNPLFRPRVETLEQARDLVKNGLFERVLRRTAVHGHLERHPAVLQAVRRQEEYLASQYYVTREVYGAIPTDEATLRRYFDRDPGVWTIPARLRVVRLLLAERGEAARMAVRLRDPAEADSLVARGLRQRVDYGAEITAASDSALFAAAMRSGTGTVLGPDSLASGWQVVRVNAVLPAQGRSFEEVRELVLRAWSDEEGERRMQALLADLRRRARILVNEPGLARVVSAGAPAPARQR